MSIEHHHDLSREFPEYKARIHELKSKNQHFANLYEDYRTVDKEIYRIEQAIETPSDAYTEDLKKKRAHLKDQLYQILSK